MFAKNSNSLYNYYLLCIIDISNICIQVGGPTQQAAAVYEEFGRSLPGFMPSLPKDSTKNEVCCFTILQISFKSYIDNYTIVQVTKLCTYVPMSIHLHCKKMCSFSLYAQDNK